MHTPERILLIRLSHLGDVVQSLPLFHALRADRPQAEIGWVVQPEFAELIEGLPGIDRVFRFERRAGLRAWSLLRAAFAGWRPTWTVDGQGNVKSAMVALTAGAARRSGFARADWRERFAAHVVTDPAPASPGPNAMQRTLGLALHVAVRPEPRFDPGLTPDELEIGRRELSTRFPSGAGPAFLSALSPASDVRAWPVAAHVELAQRIADAGGRVLFLSGPQEEREGRQAASLAVAPGIRHWVGQRGLRTLAAVFRAAADHGLRLISADTGPAHLASACGVGVNLLVGPQDPARTGPWPPSTQANSPHRVLQRRDPPDCAPCFARRCAHPSGPVCLGDLSPADVADRILSEATSCA